MVNNRGLIFLHIPKAAGSTLRPVIARNYAKNSICRLEVLPRDLDAFLKLPVHTRNEIRVLLGHLQFGVHEHVSVPVDYVTILREPVERIISMYYWIKGNHEHVLNDLVKRMSLSDFASSGFEITTNHQSKLISGLLGNSTDEALSVAKTNLQSHITAFGLNERFDESLTLFKSVLGWKQVWYVSRNVTKNRPHRSGIPDSTLEVIKKHNALDIELYEFAKNRFDEIISKRGQSFQEEVRQFRRWNRVYGTIMKGKRRMQRALPHSVKAGLGRGLRLVQSD
jgi:Galactose-3-O-sulfotransferase